VAATEESRAIVTSQSPFWMRYWFNLNISLILLRTVFRATAFPSRFVTMIPILDGFSVPRVRTANTKYFPLQDLPDALTKLNSEPRLKRDDRENLNRIRLACIVHKSQAICEQCRL
jgi:hypothetical protein